YLWHIYCHPEDMPDSDPEVIESDESDDVMEIIEGDQECNSMNETLNKMYKSPASRNSTPAK
ncbi:hypothetical protein SK128_027804, partial [Halocaridina rubra]